MATERVGYYYFCDFYFFDFFFRECVGRSAGNGKKTKSVTNLLCVYVYVQIDIYFHICKCETSIFAGSLKRQVVEKRIL